MVVVLMVTVCVVAVVMVVVVVVIIDGMQIVLAGGCGVGIVWITGPALVLTSVGIADMEESNC